MLAPVYNNTQGCRYSMDLMAMTGVFYGFVGLLTTFLLLRK